VPDAPAIAVLTEVALLPIPAAVAALDGRIVGLNRAAEALVGRKPADVIGRMAWDLAPGVEYIWQDVMAAARQEGTYRGEITIATPQEPREIHYVVTLREEAGATYVLAFALPMPDERSARDRDFQSKHRLEALGLVAGGIAHDFNNQLVSVLAEASAAREDATLTPSTRDALHRIEAAAHRMAQLTRQLLAYAGRGRFVTEVIDPDDLVQHSRAQLGDSIRPDANLRIACNAGRVAIEADRALLRQVVANLVANASDALGEGGGTIELTTRVEAGSWVLAVSDTGTGMDALTATRIFDPFFTTRRDRHGLGLSAVHGIVRRLGGEIAVNSKVGYGTTITVRLPLVAGTQAPRARSTSKQAPISTLTGMRILVADDEASVLATVRRLLERRGATVVVATDGAQAKARLSEGEYQLVLFDVMMPELTGYQLLPFARELQPNARVMLMSGYTDHSLAAGSGVEPDAFLEKPFTAKALDRAIEELFGSG
jgi:signal transduction histidine kinase